MLTRSQVVTIKFGAPEFETPGTHVPTGPYASDEGPGEQVVLT